MDSLAEVIKHYAILQYGTAIGGAIFIAATLYGASKFNKLKEKKYEKKIDQINDIKNKIHKKMSDDELVFYYNKAKKIDTYNQEDVLKYIEQIMHPRIHKEICTSLTTEEITPRTKIENLSNIIKKCN